MIVRIPFLQANVTWTVNDTMKLWQFYMKKVLHKTFLPSVQHVLG